MEPSCLRRAARSATIDHIRSRISDPRRQADFAVFSAGTTTATLFPDKGGGIFDDPVVLQVGGDNCRSIAIADFTTTAAGTW